MGGSRAIKIVVRETMKTIVVVPCGKRKIWDKYPTVGPVKARDAYIGTPFKVNREYAENFSNEWVILSAKYGFINPDFIIPENYNVTFNNTATNPITIEQLKDQVRERLTKFGKIVALGGKTYTNMVPAAFEQTGAEIITPTAGLPIGRAIGIVKNAIREKKPFGV